MEFIDNSGHIFSLKSYDRKPIGYEYEEHPYIFWIDNKNKNKLSINNYYGRSIYIAYKLDQEAYNSNEIDLNNRYKINISMDSSIYRLLPPNKINNYINNLSSLYDNFEIKGVDLKNNQTSITNDDAILIKSYNEIEANNINTNNKETYKEYYAIIPIYVLGYSKNEGTWMTNILININDTALNVDEWCYITIGGIFVDNEEALVINGKNMGINLPKDILKAVYQCSYYNESFDEALFNKKMKEYLLNYMNIKGECGNFKSAIDSLKWFGYGNHLSISKLLKTDNEFQSQYIHDYFNSSTDIIRAYKDFINTSYISIKLMLNRPTGKLEEQYFHDGLWGEGKPIMEDLTNKYTKIEVGYEEEKYYYWKPYYDFSINELGLKLMCLKYYYEKYFLPLYLKIHSLAMTYTVHMNDIKFSINRSYTSITEPNVYLANQNNVKFNDNINTYWFTQQIHIINESYIEEPLNNRLNDNNYYVINDTCASIPITLFGNKVYDCLLILENENNKIYYEDKFTLINNDNEELKINFVIYPKYLNKDKSTGLFKELNDWLNTQFKLHLLVNGRWYDYIFTLKLPTIDLQLGTLSYQYYNSYIKDYNKLFIFSDQEDTNKDNALYIINNTYNLEDFNKYDCINLNNIKQLNEYKYYIEKNINTIYWNNNQYYIEKNKHKIYCDNNIEYDFIIPDNIIINDDDILIIIPDDINQKYKLYILSKVENIESIEDIYYKKDIEYNLDIIENSEKLLIKNNNEYIHTSENLDKYDLYTNFGQLSELTETSIKFNSFMWEPLFATSNDINYKYNDKSIINIFNQFNLYNYDYVSLDTIKSLNEYKYYIEKNNHKIYCDDNIKYDFSLPDDIEISDNDIVFITSNYKLYILSKLENIESSNDIYYKKDIENNICKALSNKLEIKNNNEYINKIFNNYSYNTIITKNEKYLNLVHIYYLYRTKITKHFIPLFKNNAAMLINHLIFDHNKIFDIDELHSIEELNNENPCISNIIDIYGDFVENIDTRFPDIWTHFRDEDNTILNDDPQPKLIEEYYIYRQYNEDNTSFTYTRNMYNENFTTIEANENLCKISYKTLNDFRKNKYIEIIDNYNSEEFDNNYIKNNLYIGKNIDNEDVYKFHRKDIIIYDFDEDILNNLETLQFNIDYIKDDNSSATFSDIYLNLYDHIEVTFYYKKVHYRKNEYIHFNSFNDVPTNLRTIVNSFTYFGYEYIKRENNIEEKIIVPYTQPSLYWYDSSLNVYKFNINEMTDYWNSEENDYINYFSVKIDDPGEYEFFYETFEKINNTYSINRDLPIYICIYDPFDTIEYENKIDNIITIRKGFDDVLKFTIENNKHIVMFIIIEKESIDNITINKNNRWAIDPRLYKIASNDYLIDYKPPKDDNSINIFDDLFISTNTNDQSIKDLYNSFFEHDYTIRKDNGDVVKHIYKSKVNIDKDDVQYDFYLMHDYEYWYGVFISRNTINHILNASHKNINNNERRIEIPSIKIRDNIFTNGVLKHNRSDNVFLINRMQFIPANGYNQFNKDDVIGAYVHNNIRLDINSILYDSKWKIEPVVKKNNETYESFISNAEMTILPIPENGIEYNKGYYNLSINYSLNGDKNYTSNITTKFKIK